MLDVVEACQGKLIPDYCMDVRAKDIDRVCAYHHAVSELFDGMNAVLSKWTLARLASCPQPHEHFRQGSQCRMAGGEGSFLTRKMS